MLKPPPILDYAPGNSPLRELLRRSVSAAKTLAWVVPLTLLIWVYAEREQVADEPVQVPFTVRINIPNRIVKLNEPREATLACTISGPRASLDNIARELVTPHGQPTVQINIDPKLANGIHYIDAISAIANDAVFANHGFSIEKCTPPQIVVNVDDLSEQLVEVAAPDLPQGQSIRFVPDKVKVRAPQSIWNQTKADKRKVTAMIGNGPGMRSITGLEQGDRLSGIPLRWNYGGVPGDLDENITISPSTVDAIVVISEQNETYTLKNTVAVYVMMPFSYQGKWQVNYNPTLADVQVSGPPDLIAEVKKNETKVVHAYLLIQDGDADGKPHENQINFLFDLPDTLAQKGMLKVVGESQYKEHYILVPPGGA